MRAMSEQRQPAGRGRQFRIAAHMRPEGEGLHLGAAAAAARARQEAIELALQADKRAVAPAQTRRRPAARPA